MPAYSYIDGDGVTREVRMSVAEYERASNGNGMIKIAGKWYKRDFRADLGGFRNTPGTYPMASEAMGCHPSQIAAYAEEARKRGVPTNFTKDGRPVLEDREHRKRFAEAFGFYDRNGGYSDPQRR